MTGRRSNVSGGRRVAKTREQELIDIMFQVAFTAAEKMHEKSTPASAAWVAEQLKQCGFPTMPQGASWGVLDQGGREL